MRGAAAPQRIKIRPKEMGRSWEMSAVNKRKGPIASHHFSFFLSVFVFWFFVAKNNFAGEKKNIIPERKNMATGLDRTLCYQRAPRSGCSAGDSGWIRIHSRDSPSLGAE